VGLSGSSSGAVFGISANAQTLFERIHPREFDTLVPAVLISVRFNYNRLERINSPIVRCSINWRKKGSSGHMFLSLARVVLQPFFVFSPAEIQSKGAVGFIKLYVRKSR